MRSILLTLLVLTLRITALAQTPITGYTIVNNTTVTVSSNSNLGWNTAAPYINSTTYTHFYGRTSAGATNTGLEREVTGFNIGATAYSRMPSAGGLPFESVIVNRHPSSGGDTINTLYEYTASVGNNLYYGPSYIGTLEGVINSFVCNRGSDNTFSNSPTTQANIERIDLIKTGGILCVNATRQGFLINERNGNDNFKVAAITTLTGSNTVNSLGSLLSVTTVNWGVVGPAIISRVMSRRTGSDAFLRAKQDIGSQTVSGVFISFASLGISAGTTIYGLSVFPADVTGAMDLIGLTNVPSNTDAGTNGGMDMMAGGGYFQGSTVSLSGRIYNDVNGLIDGTVNGSGTGLPGGVQMYVNLVDPASNKVISSVAVQADGTYSFPGLLNNTTYSVRISTAQLATGATPTANALPSGWTFTGDNLGAGSGNDGSANGTLSVAITTTNITNANFGIERPPVSVDNTQPNQTNPGGTNTVALPATAFSAPDPDGGTVSSIRIIAFPGNVTSVTINGTTYTSGTWPALGVTVPANASGEPTQAIAYDPVDGVLDVTFSYAGIDNAGLEDASPATITIPFTATLPVTITRFVATVSGVDARLDWETEAQVNFLRFEIERSASGIGQFETVGIVLANNGNAGTYQYIDRGAGNQLTTGYYRLKLVDRDGQFNYSRVSLVRFRKGVTTDLRPTLLHTGERFAITRTGNLRLSWDVEIRNQAGQLIYLRKGLGQSVLEIQTNGWQSGIYVVIIRGEEGLTTERVVLQ